MKTFKTFITEGYYPLEDHELLQAHIVHCHAGIPLPDRNDLYRAAPRGNIMYNTADGGRVVHNLFNGSIHHQDKNYESHRLDGPAEHYTDMHTLYWYKHGSPIGKANYHTGGVARLYQGSGLHNMFTDNIDDFNQHLKRHGFPEYKQEDYQK